jgi:ubiquinone/menaquinone biosynthesis C-methylase UbiE
MNKIGIKKNIVERHSPVGRKDYLSIQHIERYKFALKFLRPSMKVLDIACGTGYGSAILVNHGCDVTGADYDKEAIHRAKEVWDYDGFVNADALDLPFQDGSFDAVVTFETIEHVYDYQTKRFLQEMKRVLKPGGLLICSTPNIRYTFHPDFHLHEFYAEEFFDAVQSEFKNIQKFGQYFGKLDRLRDLYLRKILSPFLYVPVRFVEKLLIRVGFRAIASKVVLGNHSDAVKKEFSVDLNAWLANVGKENVNKRYGVVDYRGEKMCRIMLIVSRGDE